MSAISMPVAGASLLLVASAVAAVVPKQDARPAPFEKVRAQLLTATSATVTAACGSTTAPWAYRGPRGDSLALKAFARAERGDGWARNLARALMVKADWDSTGNFRGRPKLCRETHEVPYFVVCWYTEGDEIYALFNLESRCARLFKVNQPLGTMWFRDRADTLFGMIREALGADSTIAAMSTPAEVPPTPDAGRTPDDRVWVDKLPSVKERFQPEYPTRARELGWQGTVLVQALVGEDGAIHDAIVVESVRGLDDPALACVWDWKFEPARAGGKPVAVWVAIPIKFTLQ